MNILLTGANGFIGRYLLAALLAAGHRVIPAVRRPLETDALLPEPASIAADFNIDVTPADWLPRLDGIDAVINCAGILQARGRQSIEAIHMRGPAALASACREKGVRRFIQISAISAREGAGSAYAATKQAGDDAIAATDLDWVILRPSLIYAAGAYGGTALFRAIAALPFRQPLPGQGEQIFQPIHINDLCQTVLRLLATPSIRRTVIDPVGPDILTLRQILADLRLWLGYPQARFVRVPMAIVRCAARAGDVLGGPLNTTALRQIAFGNAGNLDAFVAASGIQPRPWREALRSDPAQTQDRWHARLYFTRPLLRLTLALMWIVSGLLGLSMPTASADAVGSFLGLPLPAIQALTWSGCFADIAIGFLVAARYRPGLLAAAQLTVIAAYTLVLGLAQGSLWADPLGPLLKNFPIMAAVLVLGAIEADR